MKVLFVCSGNSTFGINPLVKKQGNSLINLGIKLDFFTIKGKGVKGYLSNVLPLFKLVKNEKYDIVHSHYFDSSFITSLAVREIPQVVSLMGSELYTNFFQTMFIKFLSKYVWSKTIVKSQVLFDRLTDKNALIIPNGVDISVFQAKDKKQCREKLGLGLDKKYVLFLSNPGRPEKNFKFAQRVMEQLNNEALELLVIFNQEEQKVVDYLNASDVMFLTSLREGSPNVIKEALACNCPIVTTDVGDVRWLVGKTEGCFITSFDVGDTSKKLHDALDFSEKVGRIKGKERIKELGLDSETIAKIIIDIYDMVLHKH